MGALLRLFSERGAAEMKNQLMKRVWLGLLLLFFLLPLHLQSFLLTDRNREINALCLRIGRLTQD